MFYRIMQFFESGGSLTLVQNKTRCATSMYYISEAFKVNSWPKSASTCLPVRVLIFEHGKTEFYLYMCHRHEIQVKEKMTSFGCSYGKWGFQQ